MTDLYLIAHKVHSEPAFDIATQVPCVHCQSYESVTGAWCEAETPQNECDYCDREGFVWMIPTSGHRAYPWWSVGLKDLQIGYHDRPTLSPLDVRWDNIDWPSYPDHYTTRASPKAPSLTSLLAIPRPQLKVDRRF